MAKEHNIFDDVLRQAAEGMEIPSVVGQWDAIAGGLDRRKRRRKMLIWGSVALPLLIIGSYFSCSLFTCDKQSIVEHDAVELFDPLFELPLNSDGSNKAVEEGSVATDSELPLVRDGGLRNSESFNRIPRSGEQIDQSVDVRNIESIDEVPVSDEVVSTDADGPVQGETDNQVPAEAPKEASIVETPSDDTNIALEKLPTNKSSSMNPGSGLLSGNLELGLSVSPGIASKIVSESDQFAWLINRNYKKSAGNESSAYSYQIDLYLNKYLGDKFYVGSGVRFVERAERVDYSYKIDELVTVRTSEQKLIYTPLAPALVREVSYSGLNRYQFIDVPLKFGYIASINSKIGWRTELGLSMSYLMGADVQKVHATTLELSDAAKLDLQRFNPGWNMQSGIIYPLGTRSSLTVDALYTMNLGSWRSAEQGILEKPYNYGLMLGWKYKFSGK
ncbi:MAG: hypothetical protein H6606_02440 [Flavobacteriales bacterium]|nr:hypothetical protein [Flavobacteriales bacterium]